jgi:hypothetical protein
MGEYQSNPVKPHINPNEYINSSKKWSKENRSKDTHHKHYPTHPHKLNQIKKKLCCISLHHLKWRIHRLPTHKMIQVPNSLQNKQVN